MTRMFQVKIGIRNIVMPGRAHADHRGDHVDAPRMVPRPATARPMIHRSPPAPGRVDRVGQRRVGGPAEVGGAARGEEAGERDQSRRTGTASSENAFSRGNATSGAPICSGSTRLANPNTIGVA